MARRGGSTYDLGMDTEAVAGPALVILLAVVAVAGPRRIGSLGRRVASWGVRFRPTPPAPPVLAPGRPIELVARDACRLGRQFAYLPAGVSFARFEGCRRAYDRVLTEACEALDVDHLLGVLPPGPDLDRERSRVELALEWAGLRLDGS